MKQGILQRSGRINNTPKIVWWPSTQTLKEAIGKNKIRNWPITIYDITRSEAIYGPHIPIIQVNAIRRRTDNQKTTPRIALPPTPAQCVNSYWFFCVNGSRFLCTKSRNFYLRSVQACNIRGKSEIISDKKKSSPSTRTGFSITDFHGYNEFEHIQDFLSPSHLHTCTVNEHIGDIEWSIHTIKERMRCGFHSMPIVIIKLNSELRVSKSPKIKVDRVRVSN